MKDLFVITVMVEEVNELAKAIEKELMKPADENDVDFEMMQKYAERLEDAVGSLTAELEDISYEDDEEVLE